MNRVAVIMSVYKNDKLEFLKQAVESVLEQTYKCDLFIYIDGPLPDDTSNYLNSMSSHQRIHLDGNEKNNGLAYALNFLIDKTKGYEYIARMDSDDVCRIDRIYHQVKYMEQYKSVDVLGGACREFGAEFALEYKALPNHHNELVNFSISRCPFIHPTVMFRGKIFSDKNMRYPENTVFTEDMAFWFLLIKHGYIFANIDNILLDYRINANTINRRKGFSKAISEVRLRFHYMNELDRVSVKNFIMLSSRLVFHILPLKFMKVIYNYCR